MGAPLLKKHFAELHSASTPTITVAVAGSFAGQVMAVVQGAPVWVFIVVALAPWVPMLALEVVWTYRHYRWLAVFCLLEQVARMVQTFALQLGRTYNAWLARAFPNLPERLLIDTTGHLEEVRLRPGERADSSPGRQYIVTRGRGMLFRDGPGGHEILLRVLAPGQIVSAPGTFVAETALELLALPANAAAPTSTDRRRTGRS